jgi:hypothetical protein
MRKTFIKNSLATDDITVLGIIFLVFQSIPSPVPIYLKVVFLIAIVSHIASCICFKTSVLSWAQKLSTGLFEQDDEVSYLWHEPGTERREARTEKGVITTGALVDKPKHYDISKMRL